MSSDSSESSKVENVERIGPLDQTRKELEEEFNVQRAKMKELFLQKEEDMRKMIQSKEHLESEVMSLRAELQQLQTLSENQKSEIQSLQMLVSETVEVSSSGSEEVRRLRGAVAELEQQLRQQQQQQEVSLAPAMLVRSLARKLGADADDAQPRKQNSEDNELLKSIIQPLEMEISVLKTKLRDTDTQLQESLKWKAAGNESTSGSGGDTKTETESARRCDMCANYEKQLVEEQRAADSARERTYALQLALKQATEELEGIRSLHDETIRAWAAERGAGGARVEALRGEVERARAELGERAAAAGGAARRALHQVTLLTVQRETLQGKLDSLEKDNAMLVGKYIKKAAEIQNEVINLPSTVEELQELSLRLREQLIFSQLGREEAERCEAELRAQLLEQGEAALRRDHELAELHTHHRNLQEELDRLQVERSQIKELADKLRHSSDIIEQLLEDKKRLQTEVSECRSRISVLQQELDNSEKVQQDFVRLSQSLQVQLQRIREADTEVRWQLEDDVNECPACHVHLPSNKKKMHCRHCGRVFCQSCVASSVPAGPRRLPARVCAVCCTLLRPHAAPYFSSAPPPRAD